MKTVSFWIKAAGVLFLGAALFGCTALPRPAKAPLPDRAAAPGDADARFAISDIAVSRRSFNPSLGETVEISCRMSRPGKALFRIFDAGHLLVNEFVTSDDQVPGLYQAAWDGTDLEGRPVPDDAYFFTIEANAYTGELTYYDPISGFGGESFAFPVTYDAQKKAIAYTLPEDARVLIRAGITRGPLLKTIVNWRPRPAGANEEPWDGRDDAGVIDAAGQEGFTMMSDAVALPENSIFTRGNPACTLAEFKRTARIERPPREARPGTQDRSGAESFAPGADSYTPFCSLALPEDLTPNQRGAPIVSGQLPVKIHLDEGARLGATERRYEIICYVDFRFVMEQEEGYSPSTWLLDTRNLPNGEHVLTVNVATLGGHMSSASCRVDVRN